ncbi:hypothetical protein IW261DRAFT_1480238 [Armillaria novae-zelandiae]|uniref:Uncharacterized protein n=1 Tax=Armillaria novae-zelandiae TaxID=153914 RepID=A0AA39P8Z9_9AGAR|nr:hypothetical protein IW261DRAFT_1480205 [Armillaria novae-zelandiae]KAK0479320.1 hypothetical protein IW261DRAFT_1480238 [Armillaria novae-zelandiae]
METHVRELLQPTLFHDMFTSIPDIITYEFLFLYFIFLLKCALVALLAGNLVVHRIGLSSSLAAVYSIHLVSFSFGVCSANARSLQVFEHRPSSQS